MEAFVEQYTGIGNLSEEEIKSILSANNYFGNDLPDADRRRHPPLERVFTSIISSRTIIGFTTSGHTGEDVFLASYHPRGRIARGLLDGVEINQYLLAELALTGAMDRLTDRIFSPHTGVFEGMTYEIVRDEAAGTVTLKVENGANSLSIDGNTNIAVINGRREELPSVAVYVSNNEAFYLPRSLRNRLQ
jgi:alkaline phosphatase